MASQLPGDVLLEVLKAMHEALDDGHLGGVGGGDLDERADLLLLQVIGDSGMHELSYQGMAEVRVGGLRHERSCMHELSY